ncbi:MAG: hypothetical protein JWM41_1099 [Gemmatimonadetes bacterium]|nr:hypothetical protein [Gemmatimonadota bacterium]
MTSALRSPASRPVVPTAVPLGDAVAERAAVYAARMNAGDFSVALRAGRLAKPDYVAFLALMYPLVVGFNRALIRSISKVDHVRRSSFVRVLAKQLEEEQVHNQLWRDTLEAFGVDHEALYDDLEAYLAGFDCAELDRLTESVLSAVTRGDVDDDDGAGSIFPNAPFPDAVLALYHQLWIGASRDDIGYWEHFAGQAAIEMIIFDVVSTSILPGICGDPALDLGRASTAWWREHGEAPGEENLASEEKRHLELSRIALNRSGLDAATRSRVLHRAESVMRLFAATLLCQPLAAPSDALAKFLR